ncbi:MAG: hypothetical protein ACK5HT_18775 [Draconibacterium sp.]
MKGFASKEQARLFPLLLLPVVWLYGRFTKLPLYAKSGLNKVFLEKIPFFVLAGVMWYFSWQNNLGNLGLETGYPAYQRFLFFSHSLMQYIFRFIAPVKLYYFYFYPIDMGEPLPLYYWGYPILVAIVAFFVWENQKRNNRLVVFGAVFMAINLLLVLHIVPMPRKMITADRYMYLGIMGIALVFMWLVDYFRTRFAKYKRWSVLLMIIVFVAIGTQSFFRVREWKNSTSIKRNIHELIKKRSEQEEAIVNNSLRD